MTDTNKCQFVVEPFTDCPTDTRFALDMLGKVFDKSYFSNDDWNWKYFRNPFGRSIIIAAWASDEGQRKLAGFRAFWRWRFRYHNKIVQAAQPCDTAVCPEYRRMGLFSQMTTKGIELASEEAIEFLFNNPNPESKAGYLKLGWQNNNNFQWYAKPVRKMAVLGELLRWRGHNPALQWTGPSRVWDGNVEEEKLHALFNRCMEMQRGTLWTDRSTAFYQWRYGPASHRIYNVLFFTRSGDYIALLVYGSAKRGGLYEVQILDFLTDRSNKDSLREMLQQLIETERPDWITFAATKEFPFLSELRKTGFSPLPRTATLVTRSLSKHAFPCTLEALSLTLGDLDTF